MHLRVLTWHYSGQVGGERERERESDKLLRQLSSSGNRNRLYHVTVVGGVTL